MNINKAEDRVLYVQINHYDDMYDLCMPYFQELNEVALHKVQNHWEISEHSEIKSLLCEHNVWVVQTPPRDANFMPLT